MTKEFAIESMKRTHDAIKEHPFRNSFNGRYVSSYKNLLYKLSENWCDLIYHCDDTDDNEKKQLMHFGSWIHNYRQELRTYDKEKFPMKLFDYYERMVQITHNYINNGDLTIYFKIDYFSKNGSQYNAVEKYLYITKEMCGIDSPELPRYFPVGRKMCVEDDVIKTYLDNCSATRYKSDDKKEELLNEWKANTKPVLIWINENMSNCDDYTHATWKSI